MCVSTPRMYPPSGYFLVTMIFTKTVGANAPTALTKTTTLCRELDEEKYAYTVYKSIDKINVSN